MISSFFSSAIEAPNCSTHFCSLKGRQGPKRCLVMYGVAYYQISSYKPKFKREMGKGEGEGGGVGAWFTVTLYSICNWLSDAADFKWPALFVTLNLKWRKKGWYVQYGNKLQYK